MTSSDDDKTVIVRHPPEPQSQQAGLAATDQDRTVVANAPAAGGNAQHALAAGTRIAEFEILELIGEGGFGIVYLAYDTQLGRNVALKEYIPAALASRVGVAGVTVKSERHEETFRAGLKSFINEARLLAQFDHHSLVKVYRFWEANGTAYMVMPYYEGATLRDSLRRQTAPPDEAWLLGLLAPLIEALAVLHGAQCYHRDIAPDNIMLLKGSGRPLLLDFGAARRVIGDMTQALTVILKPGYAPVEQYAEVPSMKQGPWTDLYALAAVVYFAIQGKTPPTAVGRLMSDSYVPLATAAAGRYSDAFLKAIDHALAVHPQDRPQNVHELAAELGIALDAPSEPRNPIANPAPNAGGSSSTSTGGGTGRSPALRAQDGQTGGQAGGMGSGAASGASSASAASVARTAPAASAADVSASSAANNAASNATSKRPAMIAAAAVCVVALAAVGVWFAMRPSAPAPASHLAAQRQAATDLAAQGNAQHGETASGAAASAGAAQNQPSAAANAPAMPETAPASAPLATAPPAAAAPAENGLPSYTVDGEFERIATLADSSFHVTTALRSTSARISKDYLQFKLNSNRAGYAYVFMVDPEGQYLMLFPNQLDKNNAIAARQTLSLPRASWPMLAAAPAGPNHFLVLVSPVKRDFSDAGLQRDSVFGAFSAAAQRDAASRRTASYSPFAGKPLCAAGRPNCPDTFGATVFRIDVVNAAK